jgi:hypothetical protein
MEWCVKFVFVVLCDASEEGGVRSQRGGARSAVSGYCAGRKQQEEQKQPATGRRVAHHRQERLLGAS